jgi:hypothetical protein
MELAKNRTAVSLNIAPPTDGNKRDKNYPKMFRPRGGIDHQTLMSEDRLNFTIVGDFCGKDRNVPAIWNSRELDRASTIIVMTADEDFLPFGPQDTMGELLPINQKEARIRAGATTLKQGSIVVIGIYSKGSGETALYICRVDSVGFDKVEFNHRKNDVPAALLSTLYVLRSSVVRGNVETYCTTYYGQEDYAESLASSLGTHVLSVLWDAIPFFPWRAHFRPVETTTRNTKGIQKWIDAVRADTVGTDEQPAVLAPISYSEFEEKCQEFFTASVADTINAGRHLSAYDTFPTITTYRLGTDIFAFVGSSSYYVKLDNDPEVVVVESALAGDTNLAERTFIAIDEGDLGVGIYRALSLHF